MNEDRKRASGDRSKENIYFIFAVPQMVRPKAFIRLTMLSVFFFLFDFFLRSEHEVEKIMWKQQICNTFFFRHVGVISSFACEKFHQKSLILEEFIPMKFSC